MADLNDFSQSMALDPVTGKPMPSVSVGGSGIVLPVNIDSRKATTIQTHNAVSIALSGSSVEASWHDADGIDNISLTILNDALTASSADIYWSHDGTNIQGAEYAIVPSGSQRYRAVNTPVKARYFKVALNNGDGAAAHTMSAWAYLKA